MKIGEVIRQCRHRQNLTQEALAELLSVSPQAVSRWECGLAVPDVAMIPRLWSLFDISADMLLCIDAGKREDAVRLISEKARQTLSDGYGPEAVRLLREGLMSYPNAWKLAADLADALFLQGEFKESLSLAERVMGHCSDMEIHAQAVFTACCVLDRTDRHREAVDLANTVPETGRHDLLRHLLRGDEKIRELRRIALTDAGSALLAVWQLADAKDDRGVPAYDTEERENLLKRLLALYRLFFEDGDLFFYAQFPERICRELAKYAVRRGEEDTAASLLLESVRYGLQFAEYAPDAPHTSLCFRGETDGGWVKDSPDYDHRDEMRNMLRDPVFDLLRKDGKMDEIAAAIGG